MKFIIFARKFVKTNSWPDLEKNSRDAPAINSPGSSVVRTRTQENSLSDDESSDDFDEENEIPHVSLLPRKRILEDPNWAPKRWKPFWKTFDSESSASTKKTQILDENSVVTERENFNGTRVYRFDPNQDLEFTSQGTMDMLHGNGSQVKPVQFSTRVEHKVLDFEKIIHENIDQSFILLDYEVSIFNIEVENVVIVTIFIRVQKRMSSVHRTPSQLFSFVIGWNLLTSGHFMIKPPTEFNQQKLKQRLAKIQTLLANRCSNSNSKEKLDQVWRHMLLDLSTEASHKGAESINPFSGNKFSENYCKKFSLLHNEAFLVQSSLKILKNRYLPIAVKLKSCSF